MTIGRFTSRDATIDPVRNHHQEIPLLLYCLIVHWPSKYATICTAKTQDEQNRVISSTLPLEDVDGFVSSISFISSTCTKLNQLDANGSAFEDASYS